MYNYLALILWRVTKTMNSDTAVCPSTAYLLTVPFLPLERMVNWSLSELGVSCRHQPIIIRRVVGDARSWSRVPVMAPLNAGHIAVLPTLTHDDVDRRPLWPQHPDAQATTSSFPLPDTHTLYDVKVYWGPVALWSTRRHSGTEILPSWVRVPALPLFYWVAS